LLVFSSARTGSRFSLGEMSLFWGLSVVFSYFSPIGQAFCFLSFPRRRLSLPNGFLVKRSSPVLLVLLSMSRKNFLVIFPLAVPLDPFPAQPRALDLSLSTGKTPSLSLSTQSVPLFFFPLQGRRRLFDSSAPKIFPFSSPLLPVLNVIPLGRAFFCLVFPRTTFVLPVLFFFQQPRAAPPFNRDGPSPSFLFYVRGPERCFVLYPSSHPRAPFRPVICSLGSSPRRWLHDFDLFSDTVVTPPR